jgi:hypothetical protein
MLGERMMRIEKKKNKPKERKYEELHKEFHTWDAAVKDRTRVINRIKAIDSGRSIRGKEFDEELLDWMKKYIKDREFVMVEVGRIAAPEMFEALKGVRGIAGSLASQMIAVIDDPSKFQRVSQLYNYCGYGTKGGKRDRRPGQEITNIAYKCARQFGMQRTEPYRGIYDYYKDKQKNEHPELTAKHIDMRAHTRIAKLFLAHVLVKWWEIEGLPVTEEQPMQILGKDEYIEPPISLRLEKNIKEDKGDGNAK